MYNIGRVCVKIAGRDGGQKCVIVDVIDNNFVLIDGSTRRRKCNVNHLEPLNETIEIKKGASHDDVKVAFKKLGFELVDKKSKKATVKPVQVRKTSTKLSTDDKPVKKDKPKTKETKSNVVEDKDEKIVIKSDNSSKPAAKKVSVKKVVKTDSEK